MMAQFLCMIFYWRGLIQKNIVAAIIIDVPRSSKVKIIQRNFAAEISKKVQKIHSFFEGKKGEIVIRAACTESLLVL
jgi:hypothetical protein